MYQKEAIFRFYAELNDFLPKYKKQVSYTYKFKGTPSIKDAFEGEGIPHSEVEMILVNSKSVGFDYLLQNGDKVSVYPVFESFNVSDNIKIRKAPLRETKFILDVHLGTLAKKLRVLGFDTLYRNDYMDSEIAEISRHENRIILTRDRALLKRNAVTHGYYVRETEPNKQIIEVSNRFDLPSQIKEFSRCIKCNDPLIKVPKETIAELLEPRTAKYYNEFYKCNNCNKIFWKGSHYERMNSFIKALKSK